MKFTFSKAPSGVDVGNGFNSNCTIELSNTALRALKTKDLQIKINKMGGQKRISSAELYIGAKKGNIRIIMGNDEAKVSFGDNSHGNFNITLWRKSVLRIGEDTSSNGTRIFCADSEVIIGNDCMFSDDVLIQSSDQHAIVDLSEKRIINDGCPRIHIGNHVWLGRSSTVLPNVNIGNGCVIGTGSIVTNDIEEKVVAAGVPARAIKHNCSWSRFHDKFDDYCNDEMGITK